MAIKSSTITLCSIILVIVAVVIVLSLKFNKEEEDFCAPTISQHQPHPQKIQKPPPNPSTMCTRPNGQRILCGYSSRDQTLTKTKFYPHLEGKEEFTELKLCNKSPVTLDIYHRNSEGISGNSKTSDKFVFSGTIPTMQNLYVYKDKNDQPFSVGDDRTRPA